MSTYEVTKIGKITTEKWTMGEVTRKTYGKKDSSRAPTYGKKDSGRSIGAPGSFS